MSAGILPQKTIPVDWLLEKSDPAVRALTLVDLLDAPESDAEVLAARHAVMREGYVPQLLALQAGDAYRADYPYYYVRKYKGLVWSLIVLAEHRATLVPQIAEQCAYLLAYAQEPTQGGFAQHTAARAAGGRMTEVIPCLTGNLVWCLLTLGYGDDARVAQGLAWLTRFMRYHDGVVTDPQIPPYDRCEACFGAHTCHMGVVKALKAYGAVPEAKRTPEIREGIDKAAAFMLMHHVDRRSHHLERYSKPGWRKFGFPLMYQTDTLEALDVLTALGYRDPRMARAVEGVLEKRDGQGRWQQENAYASERLLLPMETAGMPSKWLTLRALRVLKRYGAL